MDIFSLDAEIKKLILLRQEGEYWDFKKEWHINKADLLHDIICMENNPSPHDGFIVIGIDEETDFSVCDVVNDPNRRKTQDKGNSIQKALMRLSERQRQMVLYQYGFTDGNTHTPEEIAMYLGIQQKEAEQMGALALRTLRSPMCSKKLKKLLSLL